MYKQYQRNTFRSAQNPLRELPVSISINIEGEPALLGRVTLPQGTCLQLETAVIRAGELETSVALKKGAYVTSYMAMNAETNEQALIDMTRTDDAFVFSIAAAEDVDINVYCCLLNLIDGGD